MFTERALASRWLCQFLIRHRSPPTTPTTVSQESLRIEISRAFSEQYLALINAKVAGRNPLLASGVDETGCWAWEQKKAYAEIIPADFSGQSVHSAVVTRVKHQTMLVCVNAAGASLCPLIVTSEQSTMGVFRDGLAENVHLRVHVGRSVEIDVFIPEVESCASKRGIPDSPAVLFMDNC
jgi:hypothetical protein